MKELLDNTSGAGDSVVATPVISVGKALREARERLGLSVADVSSQTKIVPRQIEALEADDFEHLPEIAFVRGFVRSYTRILQLDAKPLLAALPKPATETSQLLPASVEVPFPRAHSPQLQNLLWLGGALLLLVPLVLYAVWHYTTPPQQPEATVETPLALPAATQIAPASPVAEADGMAASSVAVAETDASPVAASMPAAASTVPAASAVQAPAVIAAPAPVAPATVAHAAAPVQLAPVPSMAMKATPQPATLSVQPAAQAPKQQAETVAPPQAAALRLMFGAESWTEVRDGSGRVISSQHNPAGSELRLGGRAPFTLIIGRANAAQLYYRGKQVDLKPYTNNYSEVARVTLE